MLSLKGNPPNEDDDNLMKLCLREYVPDEENMMYLQCVQKAMKKRIQNVLKV